jgi:hypothetical protein
MVAINKHPAAIAATSPADRAGTHAQPRVARDRKRCRSIFDPRQLAFIPLLGSAAVYPPLGARWDALAARRPCDDGPRWRCTCLPTTSPA